MLICFTTNINTALILVPNKIDNQLICKVRSVIDLLRWEGCEL
jgi:hypothetical protein